MTGFSAVHLPRAERSVRLDTLVRLRWLAVIGQSMAVLVVHWGLNYNFPVVACLAVIGLAAWLNIALHLRFPRTRWLEPERAAWLLAFDIAELTVLLFFTGGLENPFALLFLGPVLVSAAALPARVTSLLAGFAIICATLLAVLHEPLPWDGEPPELPAFYVTGVWISLVLAIGFIGMHAWQITEESRQLADALAAAELALAREQHLSQLDGLAAAAAHELGTPLATITVIAKELQLASNLDSRHADDVRLLNEQARRCGAILAKLTELASGDPFDRMKLTTVIEEIAGPHRNIGIAIKVGLAETDGPEPVGGRNPAILYGLGSLLENAVDFARTRVEIDASWSAQDVTVLIADDGPGFAPEIISRIGEPYVTSRRGMPRRGARAAKTDEASGLGLGVFIAKTLLERSGALLEFKNRAPPERGASVRVRWGRLDFESSPATAAARA
jgi:two-component system, sensor histidine kinase RegB